MSLLLKKMHLVEIRNKNTQKINANNYIGVFIAYDSKFFTGQQRLKSGLMHEKIGRIKTD